MTKKKIYFLFSVVTFLCLFLGSVPSMAQERKLSRIERRADRNFSRQKFDKAMGQYETAIKHEKEEDNQAALHLKTARLYFMLRDYPRSAEHYGKAMDMYNELFSVDDVCNYVDALRFQGLNREAEAICLDNAYKDIYSRYQRYQNTLEALAMRHSMTADPAFEARRLHLNTPNSEFWVGNFGNKPFYAMSQSVFNDPGKLFFHRSRYFDLTETEDEGLKPQKAPKFSEFFRGIPIDMQNGPVAFSPDMRVMVATVIKYAKQNTSVDVADKSHRPFTTKLYYSVLKDKRHKFSKYKPIFPQEEGVSYAHPFLINDGKSLLFTSDMPGGYGGFDLYITHFDEQLGEWGNPVNLGPEINTEGDEIFPVIYEDRLIFSSNGLPGFGGYDLFSTFYDNDGVVPGSVNHFPYPVNSIFNDYYMCPLSLRTAYFVSDRNFEGKDDIYYLLTSDDLGTQVGQPYFGLTEEAAIKGGQLLLSGNTENVSVQTVSLKQYAPEGLLMSLYFDFDSAELTPESVRRLQQFVSEMSAYQFKSLTFDGYADEMGGDSYNMKLSEKRAKNVANYLRDNGVSIDFTVVGHGRIKLSPEEIQQEVGGGYNWSEQGINWIQVNRRARRVDIYNNRK